MFGGESSLRSIFGERLGTASSVDTLKLEKFFCLNLTEQPPPIEELEPDSEYYWKRVRKLARRRQLQLLKLKKF
jgi:hypothetical protein